jgi:D-alanyl-lipoteichoic acid acyltransferase DltB (MBOAT superfamily)
VVADSLAPFVQAVYGDVGRQKGLPLLLATYFFAAQLYFDFAGYTDMALGVARLFGIQLSPNFRSPYLATSIADFWRRWHISFSSWLLDYVFRPLQMGLRDWRKWGTPFALLITFLVSGIWHGATWGFVVWGFLHGFYLATALLLRPVQSRVHRALGLEGSPLLAPIQVLVTFHLVCFSWIFFRAESVRDAIWVVSRGATGLPETLSRVFQGQSLDSLVFLGQPRGRFLFAVAMVAVGTLLRSYFRALGVTEDEGRSAPPAWPLTSPWSRAVVYAIMVYAIAFYGTATQGFMYEQY